MERCTTNRRAFWRAINWPTSLPMSLVVVRGMPWFVINQHQKNQEYIHYLPFFCRTTLRYKAGGTTATREFGTAHKPSSPRLNLSIIPYTAMPIEGRIFSCPSTHHSSFGPDDQRPWWWTFRVLGWRASAASWSAARWNSVMKSLQLSPYKPLECSHFGRTYLERWWPVRASFSLIFRTPHLPKGSSSMTLRIAAPLSMSARPLLRVVRITRSFIMRSTLCNLWRNVINNLLKLRQVLTRW